VIFDGDDTLWATEFLYDAAREQAASLVADVGLDPLAFKELQCSIDMVNVQTLGLSRTRFPTSSVEAYEHLASACGMVPSAVVRDAVFEASASVFHQQAPVYEGTHGVLGALQGEFVLGLLTKGDVAVQQRRIAESGLSPYFTVATIVDEKDESEFRVMLDRLGVAASDVWSVGNSFRSDIAPALAIGLRAIWIDTYVWAHEYQDRSAIASDPRVQFASDIREVPDLIGTAGP
jgi:putative hydrolase of the HAD superfamily